MNTNLCFIKRNTYYCKINQEHHACLLFHFQRLSSSHFIWQRTVLGIDLPGYYFT